MKRISVIVLIIALTLSLAACARNDDNGTPTVTTPTVTTPTATTPTATPPAATTPAATTPAATTPAATGKYKDGTYSGSGTGFRGTTTVSVAVSGGKITKVTTLSYKDDQQYYSRAFSTISGEVIGAQSSSVDTVSGATYSSRGIILAVAKALSGAYN